jgi:hypothetical protein
MPEETKKVIVNEEIDFIVRNYKAVRALVDLHGRAEERLPLWLIRKIASQLDRKLRDAPSKANGFAVDPDEKNNEIYIYPAPAIYDQSKEIGLYFGLAIPWDRIVAESEADGPFAYLHYLPPSKKHKDWTERITQMASENRAAKLKSNYAVNTIIDDEKYLIISWMHACINITALGVDPDLAISSTADKTVKFIEDNLDLLVPLP